ncbi:hypothetical protein VTL71DRAFT_1402 [Oculimacula yallundae]|uniref:Uncharacterized protein n=1 Tax=Oculimacula yallundae TaxID=86028 RepID=A0ABR4CAL5_9HELO
MNPNNPTPKNERSLKPIKKDKGGAVTKELPDLSFDIRYLIWIETFRDNTRVVFSKAVVKAGFEFIHHAALERSRVDEFIVDLIPTTMPVAEIAATLFQSEMSDPTFLKRILETERKELYDRKNITFIGDILDVFQPLGDEHEGRAQVYHHWSNFRPRDANMKLLGDLEEDRQILRLMSEPPRLQIGRGSTINKLAFYAFPRGGDKRCGSMASFWPEKALLEVIRGLRSLKTLYLVLDTRTIFNHGLSPSTRFVSGATSLKQASMKSQDLRSAVMSQYQLAWALKAMVLKDIRESNIDLAIEISDIAKETTLVAACLGFWMYKSCNGICEAGEGFTGNEQDNCRAVTSC